MIICGMRAYVLNGGECVDDIVTIEITRIFIPRYFIRNIIQQISEESDFEDLIQSDELESGDAIWCERCREGTVRERTACCF